MIGLISHKTKVIFFMFIKLSIVTGAFYVIHKKLTTNQNFNFYEFIDILKENAVFSIKTVVFLVILSIFNWFFEILKWQNLVKTITNISFYKAFKESLTALTVSTITPIKIGDYLAKAIHYKSFNRKKIMILNLLSNMSQMAVTTLFGATGLLFFIQIYKPEISYYLPLSYLVIILVIVSFVLFFPKYLRICFGPFFHDKLKNFINNISIKIHFKNIMYSLIRYFIFSFQFYFLLLLFKNDIAYMNAMLAISSMYLLSSIIPSIVLFDIVIKGSVALYIFNIIGVSDLAVLSIVFLMWILNFVFPLIIGGLLIMRFDTSEVLSPSKTINL